MLTNDQIRILSVFSVLGLIVTSPFEVLHVLVWIVFHIYELFEFLLDEAISHVFDTNRQVTQIIVFYLMAGLSLYVIHRLVTSVRGIYCKVQIGFSGGWQRQKEQISDFVKRLPLEKRAQLICGFTFGIAFVAMAVF